MSPDCYSARKSILLGETNSDQVEKHLRICNECRSFEVSGREMAQLVRAHASRPSAPLHLRENLAAKLDMERQQSARPSRRLRVWMAVASLALLVFVGLVGWLYSRQGSIQAHHMVKALAADHLEFAARDNRAEFVSSSPQEIGDWLRLKLKMAVAVPSMPNTSLTGARRCNIRGRPAALIFYQIDPSQGDRKESMASLFVFESKGEDWSRMETLPAARSKKFCRSHNRGVSVLIWEDRGLTYALVTEVEEHKLLKIAQTL